MRTQRHLSMFSALCSECINQVTLVLNISINLSKDQGNKLKIR